MIASWSECADKEVKNCRRIEEREENVRAASSLFWFATAVFPLNVGRWWVATRRGRTECSTNHHCFLNQTQQPLIIPILKLPGKKEVKVPSPPAGTLARVISPSAAYMALSLVLLLFSLEDSLFIVSGFCDALQNVLLRLVQQLLLRHILKHLWFAPPLCGFLQCAYVQYPVAEMIMYLFVGLFPQKCLICVYRVASQ